MLTKDPTFDRLAAPYDRGMAVLERLWLRRMRAQLVPLAQGKVLEIGVGTGANLPFYHTSICLTAVDESAEMLVVAAQRAASLNRCSHLLQADIERLVFSSDCFDTIVASLVLCSVVDPRAALGELRRVLRKPGGRLLLLEHMRPHAHLLGWLIDLADIPWYAFNGRCHLNRETLDLVVQSGFELEQVEARTGGLFRLIVARIS